ncbi:ribosomal protein P0 (A0) (L10E) [Pichia californica]|uniref:Large ribosomal subunit protein uL10 n=1 Tax=Pichia californica TaxID=460514 RepID=A0A9P7BCV1_9ASCO|nr:ribosomal protein P0 (A0) (L10E) [[Candida] californica]KAG0687362.1 ribosomal protein P0 (A0) (L10E) [[Candida] californica]
MGATREKKEAYFSKLRELVEEYKSVFVVGVDNVSSQQMHEVRKVLRNDAVVLMGKNTMVRRAMRGFISEFPDYEKLMPLIRGNIGFIFTNADLKTVKDVILENKVAAPARAGAIAPADVWVPAGNTGMEPGKTSFFQALGVPTKIARGTIEITTDVKILEADQKVGPSEASLLNMLNISPFTYGLTIIQVFNEGNIFPASILDISDEELLGHFTSAVSAITQISLASGYPTVAAVSHQIVNTYKNVLALSVATDYTFEGSEQIKDRIANPEAYAAAAPVAAASGSAATETAAAEEEEEESEDDDMDQYTYHHEMFAQFTRRSAHTIIGRRLASTYTTSKPSSLKGVLFGFFAGVSITGFGCYYYLLDEYKTSSDAIISDILLLQKTIRNMETHIRTLESSIEKK